MRKCHLTKNSRSHVDVTTVNTHTHTMINYEFEKENILFFTLVTNTLFKIKNHLPELIQWGNACPSSCSLRRLLFITKKGCIYLGWRLMLPIHKNKKNFYMFCHLLSDCHTIERILLVSACLAFMAYEFIKMQNRAKELFS